MTKKDIIIKAGKLLLANNKLIEKEHCILSQFIKEAVDIDLPYVCNFCIFQDKLDYLELKETKTLHTSSNLSAWLIKKFPNILLEEKE